MTTTAEYKMEISKLSDDELDKDIEETKEICKNNKKDYEEHMATKARYGHNEIAMALGSTVIAFLIIVQFTSGKNAVIGALVIAAIVYIYTIYSDNKEKERAEEYISALTALEILTEEKRERASKKKY